MLRRKGDDWATGDAEPVASPTTDEVFDRASEEYKRIMRLWWISACGVLLWASPSAAMMRATIPELKAHPAVYYDETVSLECYFDKESPIWVSALPHADDWIGFFVTGNPEKALTWTGEYYNLVFAPRTIQETVRSLRGGDKITLIGMSFHYHSESLDGAGIRVEQILRGWGPDAKAMGQPPSQEREAVVNVSRQAAPSTSRVVINAPNTTPQEATKYVAIINGKRYEGLRMGDRYNFDGVDFQVEKEP